jgi:hypothetical protein
MFPDTACHLIPHPVHLLNGDPQRNELLSGSVEMRRDTTLYADAGSQEHLRTSPLQQTP